MASTTVRVSIKTRDVLHTLSQEQRRSVQEITEAAIENYRRQSLLAEANAAYARLNIDSWQGEVAAWDETLADGLENK